MAILSVISASRAGTTFTPVAAAGGGDSFPNTGKEIFFVKNGGGSSITVTIPLVATIDGVAAASRTVTVTASATRLIGPFPIGTYNDVNSRVPITYSGVTSVTVGVFNPEA